MSKRSFALPFIKDVNVFKAVSYALKLRKSMDTGLAVRKSAAYYNVDPHEIAKFLGQLGAHISHNRSAPFVDDEE